MEQRRQTTQEEKEEPDEREEGHPASALTASIGFTARHLVLWVPDTGGHTKTK